MNADSAPPTIVVGVSGSPASAAALRWAEDEAVRRHGRLRIVLSWHEEQRAFYAHPPSRADLDASEKRARRALADVVRAVLGPGPRYDATAEVVEGTAERALVTESAGADLLVLGSGSSPSIGPVVRTCLSQARCPVVVVGQQQTSRRQAPVQSGGQAGRLAARRLPLRAGSAPRRSGP